MARRYLYTLAACSIAVCLHTSASADETSQGKPQLITLAVPLGGQAAEPPKLSEESRPALPFSVAGDDNILPLATDGAFILPPLSVRGRGCNSRPVLRCSGPDYRGCSLRIYYGTNPCDDGCVLPMNPTINDALTTHWYEKALGMVLRKKAMAAIVAK